MATVASLRYKDIMDLANMLDGKDRDWCGLGIELLPEIPKNEIKFLEHGYTEEYSSSGRFIESLSSRLNVATVMDFINIAKNFRRTDIAMYLEGLNLPMNLPIWVLTWEEKKVLLYHLEMENRNDWRMFADELGYSNYEIKVIDESKRRYESPTVLLLKVLTIVKPTLKIEDMIPVCANIRRNDVVAYLRQLLDRNKDA